MAVENKFTEFSKNYLTNGNYCDIILSRNKGVAKGEHNMKSNTYYLFDNEKRIAYSKSFERVLNKTTETSNGKIYYNNILVWVQNP